MKEGLLAACGGAYQLPARALPLQRKRRPPRKFNCETEWRNLIQQLVGINSSPKGDSQRKREACAIIQIFLLGTCAMHGFMSHNRTFCQIFRWFREHCLLSSELVTDLEKRYGNGCKFTNPVLPGTIAPVETTQVVQQAGLGQVRLQRIYRGRQLARPPAVVRRSSDEL